MRVEEKEGLYLVGIIDHQSLVMVVTDKGTFEKDIGRCREETLMIGPTGSSGQACLGNYTFDYPNIVLWAQHSASAVVHQASPILREQHTATVVVLPTK